MLDHSGFLKEGQIYVRLEGGGATEYLEGTIAISRSPTNHPGDVQLVTAVGKIPAGYGEVIRGLVNCVVFSSRGAFLSFLCLAAQN